MIGKTLSAYKLLEVIGVGGMSTVYLGRNIHTGSLAALKVLKKAYTQDADHLKRFFSREIKTAKSLNHKNIVKLLDYGRKNDTYYLIYEYVQGVSIDRHITKQKKLSLKEIENIILQILAALAHSHSKGIVHRDVKPQNILITSNGNVKITDFGIAKALSSTTITQTGMFMGSPGYISPEQAEGKKVDGRSDLYSLGVILFEMLSGRLPFRADTPWAIVNMHIQQAPPDISKLVKSIPQYLSNIVSRSLSKNPSDRFSSAEEMAHAVTTKSYVEPTVIKNLKAPNIKEKRLYKSIPKIKKEILKRPISLILTYMFGGLFTIILITFLSPLPSNAGILAVYYGIFAFFFIIATLIALILIFINRNKNSKRTKSFIIATISCFIFVPIFLSLCSIELGDEVYNPIESAEISEDTIEEINEDKESINEKDETIVDKPKNRTNFDYTIISELELKGFVTDLDLNKNFIYLAENINDTETNAINGGIEIIDIEDKFDSKIVYSSFESNDYMPFVSIKDEYLYMSNPFNLLQIYDTTNIKNIELVNSIETSEQIMDIYLEGNYIYLANMGAGLHIVDIEDKSEPSTIGHIIIPNSTWLVFADKDFAYVYSEYSNNSGFYFHIIDTKNKAEPNIIGEIEIDSKCWNFFIAEDIAYLASDSGLNIIDISDKENPNIINSFKTYDQVLDIWIEDNYAYLARGDFGVQILDISNLEDLKEIYSVPLNFANALLVEDNYIYISNMKEEQNIFTIVELIYD